MRTKVAFSSLEGAVRVPSSKSCTQRALVMGLLAPGTTVLQGISHCQDEKTVIALIRSLGADVVIHHNSVRIQSRGLRLGSYTLSAEESGFALRVFACVVSVLRYPVQLTAHGTLQQRDMSCLRGIFDKWDVQYSSQADKPPLLVQGPARLRSIELLGTDGSQYLTGALLACIAGQAQGVAITWHQPTSKPYVALTVWMLGQFGVTLRHENHEKFYFDNVLHLQPTSLDIPGDWSIAACLLVAGAISGELTLFNLEVESPQADRRILDLLDQAGVPIIQKQDLYSSAIRIEVAKAPALAAISVDLTDCPDLFAPAAALAALAPGTSRLHGVARLINKESNRIQGLMNILKALEIPCTLEEDTLNIQGVARIAGGVELPTQSDHRLVLLATLLGLRAEQPVTILDTHAIDKSYPSFFQHIEALGAQIQREDAASDE